MAITAEKLLPTSNTSTVPKGTKFRMKTIEVKVEKINDILKGTLAAEKKQKDDERTKQDLTKVKSTIKTRRDGTAGTLAGTIGSAAGATRSAPTPKLTIADIQ